MTTLFRTIKIFYTKNLIEFHNYSKKKSNISFNQYYCLKKEFIHKRIIIMDLLQKINKNNIVILSIKYHVRVCILTVFQYRVEFALAPASIRDANSLPFGQNKYKSSDIGAPQTFPDWLHHQYECPRHPNYCTVLLQPSQFHLNIKPPKTTAYQPLTPANRCFGIQKAFSCTLTFSYSYYCPSTLTTIYSHDSLTYAHLKTNSTRSTIRALNN